MTQETKHIPLPWQYHYAEKSLPDNKRTDVFYISSDTHGRRNQYFAEVYAAPQAREIDRENAEFITRACNNHYQLLAALKLALISGTFDNEETIDRIQDAINKAEGK